MNPHSTDRDSVHEISLAAFAILCALSVVVWATTTPKVALGYLCLLVCVSVGLLFRLLNIATNQTHPETLQTLLDLARDTELAKLHESIAADLTSIANQRDPIFRELALSRVKTVAEECHLLGNNNVEFTSTESWRVIYEALLRSPGTHLYRSVAYIESDQYWQDAPGQQSIKLNLELHKQQIVTVERTSIIADHLWPADDLFPVEAIHAWLEQQHRHGIWIRLLRESQLDDDPDLLLDFGIYGNRAVGIQTADPTGRTIRFLLDFNFESIQIAEQMWDRLAVYATSYGDLLDQQH